MKLKKIIGVAIGIIIGVVPFFNILVCACIAFSKKNIKVGVALSVLLITQIYVISTSISGETLVKDEAKQVTSILYPEITDLQINGTRPVTTGQLRDSITTIFKNILATRQPAEGITTNVYDKFLKGNADGSVNIKFNEMVSGLYGQYLEAFNKLPAEQKNTFSFNMLSASEQNKVQGNIEEYVTVYIKSVYENNSFIAPLIFSLIYIMAIVITVLMFKGLFTDKGGQAIISTPEQSGHSDINPKVVPAVATPDEPKYSGDIIKRMEEEIQNGEISDNTTKEINTDHVVGIPVVKINFASAEAIGELPGIGSIQGINIIKERTAEGSYKNMDDLKNRISLTDRVYDNLKDRLDFTLPENAGGAGKGRVIDF